MVFINSGAGVAVPPGLAVLLGEQVRAARVRRLAAQDEPDLRVTTIYPGRTDTEMQRELIAFEGGEYDPAKFLRPETVAAAVATR